MTDTMTSKRNSRAFLDEAAHRGDGQQKYTSYRSRRNSRSSNREDNAVNGLDGEETSSSNSPTRDSSSASRSHSASALNKEASSIVSAAMSQAKAELTSVVAPAIAIQSDLVAPPLDGRPHNFGVVVPGVYRSSYPKPEHYKFIQDLQLKTMVTLVKKEEMDQELMAFVGENGIHQIIFNMKGTKKEAIPSSTMKAILQVVLDRRNYPLMIHCNHGKHRTGCVVGAVRKIEGWANKECLDEYVSYAEPKIRDCDLDYIRDFQSSELQSLHHGRFSPMQVRTFCRTMLFSTVVMLLWFVSGSQMISARERGMQS